MKNSRFRFSQLHEARDHVRQVVDSVLMQPAWIWGIAAAAALLVILGPILWLLVQAALTFLMAFAALVGLRHGLRWWMGYLRRRAPSRPRQMYRSGSYTVEILSGRDS